MRFVCDSCRAQYMISDDKVGPKGVKVRCKKCGFVILVRRQEDLEEDDDGATRVMSNPLAPLADQAEAEAGAAASAAPGAPERKELDPDSLFGDDDEDEIGAIFDSVLNSGSHSLPGLDAPQDSAAGLAATKALDVASMAKAMDQSIASEEGQRHELTPALPSSEWYVAIEDKQVGPVGIDTLKGHWDRGEIGPDSLCWRAGMADWIPLADVAELQRHLAPKASKPVIVTPAAVSMANPVPHEGFGNAPTGTIPGASAADPAPGTGAGWKPSAASALASLVKDELDVLARPAPAKRPEGTTGSGLLDVPAASLENPVQMGPSAGIAPQPLGQLPAPEVAPGMTPAPYAPMAQAPLPQPAYTVPPYVSAAPPAKKSPVALYVGGAVLLVALAVGATAMILKPGEAPVAPPVAAATPPPAQPVAVAPAPTPAPVEAPPAAAPVAPAAEAQPDAGTLVAAAAPAEPERKAEPEPKEEDEEEPTASRTRTRNTRTASASTRTTRRADPEPADTTPPPAVKSSSSDPFDDIFGDSGSKSAPTQVAKAPSKTNSTYVPPAPGGGSSAPAELAQSDIMQVVLGKRSAIVACATQAKASDPALSKGGRFVMSWNIQTSGRTSNVRTKTADIKGSKLDSCVSDIVKSMRFPAHRKSGGQDVDFPFTY